MPELMSIGGVAEAVQRSPGFLRKLEREGIIPPALRLVGSDRRAYRPEDVERIRQVLAERAARRGGGDEGGRPAA